MPEQTADSIREITARLAESTLTKEQPVNAAKRKGGIMHPMGPRPGELPPDNGPGGPPSIFTHLVNTVKKGGRVAKALVFWFPWLKHHQK